MGVKTVEAFGDSLLIVQQVSGNYQCFDGCLNAYLDKCLDIISNLDDFCIRHVSRANNSHANDLAQQASGYRIKKGKIWFLEKLNVPICQTGHSGFDQPMLLFSESQQPKPKALVSGSGCSNLF